MGGIFGVVSKENCGEDLFLGTHYLQHRAQTYSGLAVSGRNPLDVKIHKGKLGERFSQQDLIDLEGRMRIGCVSSEKQPVFNFSSLGGMVLGFDGNIINYQSLGKESNDVNYVSRVISSEEDFTKGIEKLVKEMRGDFSIISLTNDGVYAARGWGRKPLILGKKENAYSVSSESNSFENIGFEIIRDVNPGEILLINQEGCHTLKQLDIGPIKFGTFEWIYTAYPPSVIDGRTVAQVRKKVGNLLAKVSPVDADIVSPVPNSGRWHAIGFAEESEIPYMEVYTRYDYSDRSFTPGEQIMRDFQARTKLIPIKEMIKGKKIILVDDSIVRGTQMLNRVAVLKELGAKEVHAKIACPPLMSACKYGKTTKKNEDCIAQRMSLDKIRKSLMLDSLEYATVEMLEEAIDIPRENLCLSCWRLE